MASRLLVLLFFSVSALFCKGGITCEPFMLGGSSEGFWCYETDPEPGSGGGGGGDPACAACTNTVQMSPDECNHIKSSIYNYVELSRNRVESIEESYYAFRSNVLKIAQTYQNFKDARMATDFTSSAPSLSDYLSVCSSFVSSYGGVKYPDDFPSEQISLVPFQKTLYTMSGRSPSIATYLSSENRSSYNSVLYGSVASSSNATNFYAGIATRILTFVSALHTSYRVAQTTMYRIHDEVSKADEIKDQVEALRGDLNSTYSMAKSMNCDICNPGGDSPSEEGGGGESSPSCKACVDALIEYLSSEISNVEENQQKLLASFEKFTKNYEPLLKGESWSEAYYNSGEEDSILRRLEYLLYGAAVGDDVDNTVTSEIDEAYSNTLKQVENYSETLSVTNDVSDYFSQLESVVNDNLTQFGNFFDSLCGLFVVSSFPSDVSVGEHFSYKLGEFEYSIDPIPIQEESSGSLQTFCNLTRSSLRIIYILAGLLLLWRFFVWYFSFMVKCVRFVLDFYGQFFGS